MSQNTDKIAAKIETGFDNILSNWNNGSPMAQPINLPEGLLECMKRHVKGQLGAFAPELDKVPETDPRLKA